MKTMKDREAKKEALLQASSEFFLRDGPNAIDIKELTKRAGVVRANVYSIFGTEPRIAMYEAIVEPFLQAAQSSIAKAIITSAPNSSAVEQLTAVLRVTLQLFKENPLPGKIVLAHLNMRHHAFQSIHEIFKYIDSVVSRAVENGEIIVSFSSQQIRIILFSVLHGMLRAFYLEEMPGDVQSELPLSETAVHRGVLQVLRGLCSVPVQAQIDLQIGTLQT